jgi:hypothetical protein
VKSPIVRELRTAPRYSVSLPVCITWRSPGNPQRSLNAVTRDISTRGMFVVAEAAPPEGDLLEFEIDMALEQEAPLVLVRGEGRVVRTVRVAQQPSGFAVENVWFRLCDPERGDALPNDLAMSSAAPQPPFGAERNSRYRGLSVVPSPLKNDSQGNPKQGEMK